MPPDFNELARRSDRLWYDRDSGWCWFDRESSILAYNPATRTHQMLDGPLAEEMRNGLDGEGDGRLLDVMETFDIPAFEEMSSAVRQGDVRELSGEVDFLSLDDPNQLWIEVQGSCNEECIHCYANSAPADLPSLSYDTVESVVRDAREHGFEFIQFTGGDPLLWKRLPEAVSLTRELGMTPEIYTNGLKLTERLYDEFVDDEPRFAFSFYSHDPDTHNAITQTPGSWDRTRRAIQRAVEGPTPVRVGIIIMENNAGHGPDTRAFVRDELGVDEDRIRISYIQNVGRGTEVGPAAAGRGSPVDSNDSSDGRESEHNVGEDNSFNTGKLCVSYEGDVIPCIFQRWVRLGSVHERSLRDILGEPQLEQVGQLSGSDEDGKELLACGDCRFHYTLLKYEMNNASSSDPIRT